jgi:Xaa-Pro dipeptidase
MHGDKSTGDDLVTAPSGRLAMTELVDHERTIDMVRLRGYRYARVQEQLRLRDYGACLLYDPVNIRYATGTRNMTIWTMHNAARYCLVPADGPAILFEFPKCEHLAQGIETVGEVRPGTFWYYFNVAGRQGERVKAWADELDLLIRKRCGSNRRLAVDHVDAEGREALLSRGLQLFNGQEPLEHARCVKSQDEIACMMASIAVCEAALARIRAALEPGRTEIELWSILNATNSEMGGEYIETRLLSSGPRTNPWFQECSNRRIRAGDLIGIDTDMVGPFGYDADISRTFFCGPGRPSGRQRTLYCVSHEQLQHNIALMRPGTTFRELAEQAWRAPENYADQAEDFLIHGIGMCNEYPQVVPARNFSTKGYDGVLLENMMVCVESYIGERGGAEGARLEQLVLITTKGPQVLTTFPFEEELLR